MQSDRKVLQTATLIQSERSASLAMFLSKRAKAHLGTRAVKDGCVTNVKYMRCGITGSVSSADPDA